MKLSRRFQNYSKQTKYFDKILDLILKFKDFRNLELKNLEIFQNLRKAFKAIRAVTPFKSFSMLEGFGQAQRFFFFFQKGAELSHF